MKVNTMNSDDMDILKKLQEKDPLRDKEFLSSFFITSKKFSAELLLHHTLKDGLDKMILSTTISAYILATTENTDKAIINAKELHEMVLSHITCVDRDIVKYKEADKK